MEDRFFLLSDSPAVELFRLPPTSCLGMGRARFSAFKCPGVLEINLTSNTLSTPQKQQATTLSNSYIFQDVFFTPGFTSQSLLPFICGSFDFSTALSIAAGREQNVPSHRVRSARQSTCGMTGDPPTPSRSPSLSTAEGGGDSPRSGSADISNASASR